MQKADYQLFIAGIGVVRKEEELGISSFYYGDGCIIVLMLFSH